MGRLDPPMATSIDAQRCDVDAEVSRIIAEADIARHKRLGVQFELQRGRSLHGPERKLEPCSVRLVHVQFPAVCADYESSLGVVLTVALHGDDELLPMSLGQCQPTQ